MEAADAVRSILRLVGEDPNRDGLKDTPDRVTKSFLEMCSGYHQDPEKILAKSFDVAYSEMVILKGIDFVSLCEHHLLPFQGTATVAYVPAAHVVGISKLARLVECFSKRLQIQERLTNQIAEALWANIAPHGVGIIIKAHHSCMSCRGVKQSNAEMVTSCLLGCFQENPETRAEFLSLRNGG